MCRLGGFIKLDGFKDEEWLKIIFHNILWDMESGGSDATGIGMIIDGQPVIIKKDLPASQFLKTKEWERASKLFKQTKIVIAHTRARTQGDEKNNENNHPIYSKKSGWLLTHNGVIRNYDELKEKYKIKTDGEVDSEIIIRMLEQKNNDFTKALPEIQGSFTFALLNVKEPNKLRIFKHTNGMHFVYLPEKRIIFYATDKDHILDNIYYISLNLFKEYETYLIESAENDTLYEFDLDREESELIQYQKIEIPLIVSHQKVSTFKSNYSNGWYSNYENNTKYNAATDMDLNLETTDFEYEIEENYLIAKHRFLRLNTLEFYGKTIFIEAQKQIMDELERRLKGMKGLWDTMVDITDKKQEKENLRKIKLTISSLKPYKKYRKLHNKMFEIFNDIWINIEKYKEIEEAYIKELNDEFKKE